MIIAWHLLLLSIILNRNNFKWIINYISSNLTHPKEFEYHPQNHLSSWKSLTGVAFRIITYKITAKYGLLLKNVFCHQYHSIGKADLHSFSATKIGAIVTSLYHPCAWTECSIHYECCIKEKKTSVLLGIRIK